MRFQKTKAENLNKHGWLENLQENQDKALEHWEIRLTEERVIRGLKCHMKERLGTTDYTNMQSW